MLNMQPETMESAKQRLGKALERVFDAANMPMGDDERASNQRKHVFDFPDGIRFIITRESYTVDPREVVAVMQTHVITKRSADALACPKVVVHLSASFDPQFWLHKEYLKRVAKGATEKEILCDFIDRVRGRAGELFSLPKNSAVFAEPTYITPHGLIPHWLIVEEEFEHLPVMAQTKGA